MHPRIKAAIIALARATPEVEICGFIWHDLAGQPHLHPCRNIHPEPAKGFEIDVQDHMDALGRGPLLGVYHSHPTKPGFSTGGPDEEDNDLAWAEELALPCYLYCVAQDSWHSYLPPTYQPPLLGLPWVWGFQDCYSLVRQWARQQRGHHMADYDRDDQLNLRDLILDRFAAEGFERLPVAAAALGDVLMFESDRLLSNHLGVLVGPNRFLHHPVDRANPNGSISREDLLTARWLERAVCAFRLKAQPETSLKSG